MGNESQAATPINSLRRQATNEGQLAEITAGFGTLQSFELMMRQAKMLASSDIVPTSYRALREIKEYGKVVGYEDNTSAIPNCVIALNMAARMNADPLMVMQNLHMIEGRPSWSSQFIIAAINACGRYSPLRFVISEPSAPEEVGYMATEWENNKKKQVPKKVKVRHQTCYAWAIEKATGERLQSPVVSIEMAVAEGWLTKNGSKWQTMPDMMLRYRAASFFGRFYAPELLMGLKSSEEEHETIIIEHEEEIVPPKNVSVDELKKPRQPKKQVDPVTDELDQQQVSDSEPKTVAEEPEDKQPASTGGYVPTPEELAEITRREVAQAEAEERARFGDPVPVAVEQTTSRRGNRVGTNYNVE